MSKVTKHIKKDTSIGFLIHRSKAIQCAARYICVDKGKAKVVTKQTQSDINEINSQLSLF